MFRAYQPEQDRLVAVKLFRLDLAPERVHQLVAELERLIAADLTHPGIAAPIATGVSGVSAYLAQDFVAADSLDIVVRDSGRTPPADALRVAAQLCAAIDYAADAGMIHGTLHPRDILISADDVRITGLGIARALEQVGVSVPVRRPYTAPERAAGDAWDRRSDVFSVAALVFELLTGRRISGPGDPPADAVANVAGAHGESLRRVFSRALEIDPADRFATATDFSRALQMAFDIQPGLGGRVAAPRRRPGAALPATPPTAPLPADELPLLTDAMLGAVTPAEDEPLALPAVDAEPPPVGAILDPSDHAGKLAEVDPMTDSLRLAGRDPEPALDLEMAPAVPAPELAAAPERNDAMVPAMPMEATGVTEPPRSDVWPLALALVVGIAIGFGSAMLLLGRARAVPDVPTIVQSPPVSPSPTAITEEPLRGVADRPAADTVLEAAPRSAPPPQAGEVFVAKSPAGSLAGAARPTEMKPAAPKPAAPKAAVASSRARLARRSVAETQASPAEAKTGPGSLAVDSRPSGAEVFIDGKLVGSTPLVVPAMASGEHSLRLQRSGYRRWATSVRVVSGERARVAASLER